MDIPSLNENQFAVGKAVLATGIVLRNDGETFKTGENINEMYEVFESYEEAIEFSL
jgi:L-serine deaminase